MGAPSFSSFHESTVLSFEVVDCLLRLVLQLETSGAVTKVITIVVEHLDRILVDGKPPEGALMEAPDGEVFSIAFSDDGFSMLVEWNDFLKRKSFVRFYLITGDNVIISSS